MPSLESDGESRVSSETSWPCPSFSPADNVFKREDGGEQSAAVLPGREDVSEMLCAGLGSGLRGPGSRSLEESKDKRAEARKPRGGEKADRQRWKEKSDNYKWCLFLSGILCIPFPVCPFIKHSVMSWEQRLCSAAA